MLNFGKYPRWALTGAVLALSALALANCAPTFPATAEATTREPSAEATHYESPMLRELVEAGDLPPVEERLPTHPLVRRTAQVGPYSESTRGNGGVAQSEEWRPRR